MGGIEDGAIVLVIVVVVVVKAPPSLGHSGGARMESAVCHDEKALLSFSTFSEML